MIKINHLSVRIKHKAVLTDINLSFKPGQVTALLGPNGAGKTTLLKTLCQEVTLSAGSISFDNKPLENWNRLLLAQNLAVLPQHASLSFPFTVEQVVAMGLYPLKISQREGQDIIAQQLAKLDIQTLAHRNYPSLSGGEKQRVQLARVLTQLQRAEHGPVLLLDEPTSALDLAQQHRVLTLIKTLAHDQGYTVVVVLHDLNQAARYADNVVVLDRGEIVNQGAPGTALCADTIKQVWQYKPLVVAVPGSEQPLFF